MNDKIFIVCVELNNQAMRERFEHTIIGNYNPTKIMDGLYAVKTPYSYNSENIRNQINTILENNCNVFVMKSNIDASWRLNAAIDAWLRSNI